MGQLPGIFFGVVFILAGLFLILRARTRVREIQAAKDWPRASCTIVRCDVDNKNVGGTDDSGGTQYCADIKYKYNVDNASFTNDQISMGGDRRTSNREAVEELCKKYPIDSKQEISYNPDDPEEAYLELTAKTPKVEIIAGIIFFLAGIAILWLFGSIAAHG